MAALFLSSSLRILLHAGQELAAAAGRV